MTDTDLTPLDPLGRGARFESLVAGIMAAAGPELARRAGLRATPLLVLTQWTRPMLAAAAVIALASAAALGLAGRGAGPTTMQLATVVAAPTPGMAEALNVPAPVDAWIAGDRDPTKGDLIAAIEQGGGR